MQLFTTGTKNQIQGPVDSVIPKVIKSSKNN